MFSLPMILLVMAVLSYTDAPLPYHARLAPVTMVAAVILSHVAIVACVWVASRRAACRIHSPGTNPNTCAQSLERAIDIARWATVLLTPALLWGLGWGALVAGKRIPDAGADPGWELGRFFFVPQLIFLAPGVLSWLCFWGAGYKVERALRERAMAGRLANASAVHDIPSMPAYIWMQFRHHCIVLIAITLASCVEELLKHLFDKFSLISALIGALVILKILFLLPWLTTRLWDTSPLTGPLRQKLDAIAAANRTRFRNILLWKSHHMVANAAILGMFPLFRYFLLSDALLEQLNDREIEAVFAHEVGHARHRHFWWYAATLSAALMVADGLGILLILAADHLHLLPASWDKDTIAAVLELAFAAAILFFVFLPISRQFEHQADWFAVRCLPLPNVPTIPTITVHGAGQPGTAPVMTFDQLYHADSASAFDPVDNPPPLYLTPAGSPALAATAGQIRPLAGDARLVLAAQTFSNALFTLVDMTHRSRNHGGMLHPSPQRRANLLYAMATNPAIARNFDKRMLTVRLLIALMFALGIAAVVLDYKTTL